VAHKSAVAQRDWDQALSNVQICWLPTNTTSTFQLDNERIIPTWMAHTHNHFLNWQVSQLDMFSSE